jgi:hypothetical protein
MTQYVRMQRLRPQCRAACPSGESVFVHESLNRVAAKTASGPGRECGLVVVSRSFAHPHFEDGLGGRSQWDGSVLAAFAFTADVAADTQTDIAAVKASEFRDA